MIQSGNGLWNLIHEPWYVIVGVVVAALASMWLIETLKKRGWWPDTGENFYIIDTLILVVALIVIFIPIAAVLMLLGVW